MRECARLAGGQAVQQPKCVVGVAGVVVGVVGVARARLHLALLCCWTMEACAVGFLPQGYRGGKR